MRKDFIQVSGTQFVLNGQPVMLRGFILGSWMNLEHFMVGMPGTHSMIQAAFEEVYGVQNAESFFDRLLNEMVADADIAYMKQLGANALRIPFSYHYFIDDMNPDVLLERGFQALDRVVQLCARHGIYAILDLHSAPGAQNNDWHADSTTGQSLFWQYACFQRQVCALWREIARRYADNPWVAGYDLLNEPTYGLDRTRFNGFYREVTRAIREVDPDHILFLEGEDFGRSFTLLDDPEDEQSALAMHFYPFVLEENVLDPAMDDARRDRIYRDIFDRQLQSLASFHRPVWCGETGYNIDEARPDFCASLLLKNLALCEERGISWAIWTYKDARRMGVAVPRKDSDWMRFRRRLETHWSHEWEQALSMRLIRSIGENHFQPLSDELAYDLDFRVRSILHRIAVEQILKPTLREISWAEMQRYPCSFAFENCDLRPEVADRVAALLGGTVGSRG